MAKKAMVQRQLKRERMVQRHQAKRAELKAKLKDPSLEPAQRMELQEKLQKLPRNASPVRLNNRCSETGRPRGYYRKFGLGRNALREAAMRGDIPGLRKSSW